MSDPLRDELQRTLGSGLTIVRELGGGGMSHVFVARDEALRRHVAVKVLAPSLAQGVSAERFAREIIVAASLQEPHIVPVLAAGVTGSGLPYYTMPFVSGESLRARLHRSALPMAEAISILRDVAKALAYAHREGLVHRDIKPENVLLNEGTAVVTDFGIAKALSASRTGPGAEHEVQGAHAALTALGSSLGTPAYMAPEQAAGDDVDARADIYAWGVIAFELFAGRHPFAEKTTAQALIAAHIADEPPPLAALNRSLPAPLTSLVMRCLSKRPEARPATAGELLQVLEGVRLHGEAPRASGIRRAVVAIGALSIVALVAWYTLSQRASSPFTVDTTAQVTAMPDLEIDGAISPDGRFMAYVARHQGTGRVFVRQIAGGRTVLVGDTVGGNQRWPRWSPDGAELVYSREGALYRVPALGGQSRLLVRITNDFLRGNLTPAWSPDGKFVAFADSLGIGVRSVNGGETRIVATGFELHSPAWSPDGKRIAYVSGNQSYVVVIGNKSPSSIWSVGLSGDTPIRLTEQAGLNTSPVFTPDGRSLLFVSDAGGTRDVYELPLTRAGAAAGAPSRLTTGLEPYTISLASNGTTLAYTKLRLRANIMSAPIMSSGVTPSDSVSAVTDENQRIEGVDLSHDGASLVYDANRNGNADLFRMATGGGEPLQLTTDPADDFQPVWSPDDRRVAFYSTRTGLRDVYVMDADGQNVQRVTTLPGSERFPSWSPDGKRIAFSVGEGSDAGLYVTGQGAGGAWLPPRRIANAGLSRPRWSPDGRWIAAILGVDLVLVPTDVARADSDTATLPSPRIIAGPQNGASVVFGAWSNHPDTVYFLAIEFKTLRYGFYSVPVSGGVPRPIIQLGPEHVKGTGGITFATNGKRLYFTIATDDADLWTLELRRR